MKTIVEYIGSGLILIFALYLVYKHLTYRHRDKYHNESWKNRNKK